MYKIKTRYYCIIFLWLLVIPAFSQSAVKDSLSQVKKGLPYQKKYELWDSCFIVKAKGDTIFGRVDSRSDQSSAVDGYTSDMVVFFVHTNGKREQFIPNDIKELYLYAAKEKYLTLEDEYYVSDYGVLYKIIIEGECKLISNRVKHTGVTVANPSSIPIDNSEQLSYKIYYKKGIYGAKEFFKKKNKKAYKDCPSIIDDIENKVFPSDDVIERINAFNNCVTTNNKFEHK